MMDTEDKYLHFPPYSERVWIDVRSPEEYAHGHIPGAHNIPLFTDEEREKVGTTYVTIGRNEAVTEGLTYVGNKLHTFESQLLSILQKEQKSKVMVYCARGGMRSGSMGWLFKLYNHDVEVFPRGFSGFKKLLPQYVAKMNKLVLLDGPTGAGKTDLLLEMKRMGAQVIDLEGIAHHKGSAFGYYADRTQPTNEMIYSEIVVQLSRMDMLHPIFLESESKKIGSREVPDVLFNKMQNGFLMTIESPKTERIKRIMDGYSQLPQEMLTEAFEKIKKRLGANEMQEAIRLVHAKDYQGAIQIALHYYDKAYDQSAEMLWQGWHIGKVIHTTENTTKIAAEIIQTTEQWFSSSHTTPK